MSPRNKEDMTFDEWCDAAGPGCPRDTAMARRAWRLGEDPTEHRAEAEQVYQMRAEKSEDTFVSWLWIIILVVLGVGLVLIAFWSTP